MSVHWGGKGPGHVSRWPKAVGPVNTYSGATMLLDFLNPVLDPRITFSRGTNATLIDSTGKLTYAPNNLLVRSEEFNSGANWITISTAVTANATTAPNGTQTADKLYPTVSAGRLYQDATTAGASVFSFYAKAAEMSVVNIRNPANGPSAIAYLDLNTGAISGASAASASAVSVGNGWWRFSIIFATAITNVALAPCDAAGSTASTVNGTNGIFVWGAQLEAVTYQTTPSTYVATTASAYYGPRFDYDPVTLAPRGLLIEEARTNLLTQSGDLTSFAISPATGLTSTSNATVAPDGTTTARRFTNTVTNEFHRLFQNLTLVAATAYTYSVYLKNDTSNWCQLSFFLGTSVTAFANINLSTGALGSVGGGATARVTPAGNGWYRLQITATTESPACNLQLYVIEADSGAANPTTIGTVKGLYAWGAQLEAGSFATSYIPTVASTVTRNADVATMTGTNFSSWYNQSEGTFVVGYDQLSAENKDIFMAGSAGGSFNPGSVGIYGAGTSIAGYVRSSSAYTAQANVLASLGNNIPLSAAVAYKVNDVAASAMGATPVVATPPNAMPTTVIELKIMGAGVTGGGKSGHIRTIAYFNTRLPNAQLQTLTAPSLATTLSLDFTSGSYNVGF